MRTFLLVLMLYGVVVFTTAETKAPVAAHDAACETLYIRDDVKTAEICLLAADEWSAISGQYAHDARIHIYEMLGVTCRVAASYGLHKIHKDKAAYDQMYLAASIAQLLAKQVNDPAIQETANEILELAYSVYPNMFQEKRVP